MNGTRRPPPVPAGRLRRGDAGTRGRWLMLAGAFAVFALAVGVMQSYTVFLVALIREFGWGRAETSLPYALSQLVLGASAPLIGGGLLSIGLFGNAAAGALWQVMLLYGVVMTLGANGLGLVVFVPLLSRRFAERRGMAIAIVQSANGIGRASAVPLAQFAIARLGWRATYLIEGGLVGLLALPLAMLFGGAERPAGTARPAAAPGWTLGEAVKTPHFWLLFAVYLFTGLGS